MKKMQTKLLYALNFTVFLSISIVNTQMLPLLKKLDYNVVERGYILAGSAIIAILGQFLFGYLCDRLKKTKPFFYLAYLCLLIASIMMFLKSGKLFFYHFSAASIILGMVKVIMGLTETWMLEIQEDSYGKLRACGALGFTFRISSYRYARKNARLSLLAVWILYHRRFGIGAYLCCKR